MLDLMVGALYIVAGERLAARMASPTMRRRIDRAIGLAFIAIAGLVLVNIAGDWIDLLPRDLHKG